MDKDALKALRKASKKAKRIAGEKAMELHDPVEDRLPMAYAELPGLAEETYAACKAWHDAATALEAAEAAAGGEAGR